MNPTKAASRASATVVAGVAGYSSWQHIVEVARDAGEHFTVAAVLPLSIDGLILVGTMAMLDDKRNNLKPRLSARVALGIGVVATLAANIASAEPTMKARAVAAVPAIAFLVAVEVLSRAGKPKPGTSVPEASRPSAPARTAAAPSSPAAERKERPEVPAEVRPQRPAARTGAKAATETPKPKKRPAEVLRREAEQLLSADPTPTRKEVAADLGVSDRRVRQVLNAPSGEHAVIEGQLAEVSA